MRKNKFDRDIVIMLVASLVTLVSWVGFEVYRAYAKIPVPEVLEKHLVEFDPKLDSSVLDLLEKKLP